MASEWRIDGTALTLFGPDGEKHELSVDEIYSVLIERKAIQIAVPMEIANIKPSRYPLIPSIVIDTPLDDGMPFYNILGFCRGKIVELQLADLVRGHVVAEGNWYPIEPSQAADVQKLMLSSGASIGPARSLRTFLELRKASGNSGAVIDKLSGKSLSPLAFTLPSDDVPEGILGTLYPYQTSGWRWLKFLLSEGVGGLLADEMGLGKTLQIISVLSDCGSEPLRPALIAAPGSLLENWRRELERFAPHLKVLKHHGPLRTGRPVSIEKYDVVVTSYDTVVRDNSLLNMISWQAIILDEAQYIRNPIAQRTKAVKRLRRKVGLAVTGTPVENKLLDLWSIMDFILPGHLGDANSFQAHFQDDVNGAAMLEPLVSPLMLRRRVAEVAKDLPSRIDIPQFVDLDETEAVEYDSIRQRISVAYGAAATFVALASLRQFCAHPYLLNRHMDDGAVMNFSKFRRLDEIVEEIFSRGEKVIIFTSFILMADLIASHISKRHLCFAGVIDGRLSIDERQPLIDRFTAISGGAALILNPKAGGTGLNITAANHVIHYNPEWNPALEDQASARAHRRGQQLPVTVHRLLVANTVEEVIDERLARKRTLSGTAVIGIKGNDDDYADIVAALRNTPIGRKR